MADRRFLRDSAVLAIGNGLSAVLAAVYAAAAGRLLGPAEYSVVTSLLSLVYLYSLLLGPIETGISKFAALFHGENERGKLATLTFGTVRRLVTPLVIGSIGWLALTPLLRRLLHLDGLAGLWWLTLFAAGWLVSSIPRGTLRGDHRFISYGINQFVESACRLVAGIALVMIGGRAASVIAGYAIGVIVAMALGLWQLRDLAREPRAALDTRKMFAFSGPLLAFYLYFLSVGNIDMLVAKRMLTDVEAGWYGAASTLARMLFLGASPVYLVLFSRIASRKDDQAVRRRLTVTVLAIMAVALAIGYAVAWWFGGWIMLFVFGKQYIAAAAILRIVWLTTSLMVLQAVATFALLGDDQTRGSSLFVVPVVVFVVFLALWHRTAQQIALCGLATVGLGTLVVAAVIWLARDQRNLRQTVVAQNPQL